MSSDDYGKEVTEEEYTLEESELIGQLYPVLKDKNGNVIDGNLRLKVDPDWKTEVLQHIDSKEKFLAAQAFSNWHRKVLSFDEKRTIVNGLADLYVKQGCKVVTTNNEVKRKICTVLKLSSPTVNKFLDEKYKPFTKENSQPQPRALASQVIRNRLGEETLRRLVLEIKNDVREEVENEAAPSRSFASLCNSKKTKEPTIQDYVTKQRNLVLELPLEEMFVAKEQTTFDEIIKPLQRFNMKEVGLLKELDKEQKNLVLQTILETEKRLTEWIKAIQG